MWRDIRSSPFTWRRSRRERPVCCRKRGRRGAAWAMSGRFHRAPITMPRSIDFSRANASSSAAIQVLLALTVRWGAIGLVPLRGSSSNSRLRRGSVPWYFFGAFFLFGFNFGFGWVGCLARGGVAWGHFFLHAAGGAGSRVEALAQLSRSRRPCRRPHRFCSQFRFPHEPCLAISSNLLDIRWESLPPCVNLDLAAHPNCQPSLPPLSGSDFFHL